MTAEHKIDRIQILSLDRLSIKTHTHTHTHVFPQKTLGITLITISSFPSIQIQLPGRSKLLK